MGSICSWSRDEEQREWEASTEYKELRERQDTYGWMIARCKNLPLSALTVHDLLTILEKPTLGDSHFYTEDRIKRLKKIINKVDQINGVCIFDV